ncbi:hypothetical protein ACPRNU_25110 [Chromobacterium vaccinii]|uniref:hypothetical protein n=1 Tax=Chromobacterium vaccinii TaxID=1108595 RepID=UPI003C73EAE3
MQLRILLCAAALAAALPPAQAASPAPATGGTLPNGQNSDQLVWDHFADVVSATGNGAVRFETWASDEDIYETNPPVWPDGSKPVVKRLHPGLLQRLLTPHALRVDAIAPGTSCDKVNNPAAGNFPTSPSDGQAPCYAEEVRRNRPSFDYIVQNNLYTTAGLQAAWKRTQQGQPVSLPTSAIEVKADWVPIKTLVAWLGQNGRKLSEKQAMTAYYTTRSQGVVYGLAGLHISSKEIPNWVWATFEHQYNPGRCDTMGCHDSYGAATANLSPAKTANTQYPACVKTPALKAVFKLHGLAKVWDNYCLKASQISYTSASGAPLINGNSFTERVAAGVPINQASCVACHAAAGFNQAGKVYTDLLAAKPSPTGNVQLPADIAPNDFIWGILFIKP